MGRVREVLNADCLEAMRSMGDCTFDAVVTDPPYGLEFMGAGWDAPWKSDVHVGKTWDSGMSEVTMADGYKRLKRPSFENTQNVRCRKCGKWKLSSNPCTCAEPDFPNIKLSNMRTFQHYMTPIFAEALRVAKPGAHMLCFGGTRTFHRLACAIEDAGWEIRDCIMWVYGSGFPKSMDISKAIDKELGAKREVVGKRPDHVISKKWREAEGRSDLPTSMLDITAPATDEAKRWDGWGTCLKPAWEPIIVARKPLDGTVARNVMEHGTGALNIDACRVPTGDKLGGGMRGGGSNGWDRPWMHDEDKQASFVAEKMLRVEKAEEMGRFPANLVHDGSDEVTALFPEAQRADGHKINRNANHANVYGGYTGEQPSGTMHADDGGSAARFFYCAKASAQDRGDGNDHPTVKPNELMRWLVRLVCRKDGIVLDPFCGSGSTGVACVNEGMSFVGIDQDEHYCGIARRRIEDALPHQQRLF